MTDLSRNAQVLKFFAQQCTTLPATALLKFAYLADVEARKYLGRPITEFDYIWYTYGPFDRAFYSAIEELKAGDYVEQNEQNWAGYRATPVTDLGKPAVLEFDSGEAEILQWVVKSFRSTRLQDLLEDIVYQTEPMKEAKEGQPLPMHVVDGSESSKLGLDFNAILTAEREAAEGNAQSVEEVFRELRESRTGVRQRADQTVSG